TCSTTSRGSWLIRVILSPLGCRLMRFVPDISQRQRVMPPVTSHQAAGLRVTRGSATWRSKGRAWGLPSSVGAAPKLSLAFSRCLAYHHRTMSPATAAGRFPLEGSSPSFALSRQERRLAVSLGVPSERSSVQRFHCLRDSRARQFHRGAAVQAN